MVFTFDEVLLLKKEMNDKYHLYLHYHDTCGSQFFTFDEEPPQEASAYIEEFYAKKGAKVQFFGDNKGFKIID